MQDKKNRDIVDSQGNVIKSIKDNKTKQFLKDNIWNILSTGLATSITLVEMINLDNFKKLFCFVFEFLWNRWKIL